MKHIDNLREIDKSLDELKKHFHEQMNTFESDLNEFHHQVITLSAKYPENKELLEFIVFINDRIETSHTNMREIVTESLNEFIDLKKKHINTNILNLENPDNTGKWYHIKELKGSDLKYIVIGLFGLVALLVMLIAPDSFWALLAFIKGLL